MPRPKKPSITIVSQAIHIQQLNQLRPDINKWRNALRAAEMIHNPLRIRLYEVYKELMLDAHLYSLVDKRIRKIVNKRIRYVHQNNDTETINEQLFYKSAFRKLLKYTMESIFYGHSLIELITNNGELIDCKLIPRHHVRPELGIVTLNTAYDSTGISYREKEYSLSLIEIDREDLGLLNIAAANVIYKRQGKGDFANFVEQFGSPIKKFEYDPLNPKSEQDMKRIAEESGNSASVVMPKGIGTLEFVETKNTSGSTVHIDFLQEIKDELTVLILAQTMTTQDGSSRSQAEVHQDEQQEQIAEDIIFAESMLNEKLKPILIALGYPIHPEGMLFLDTSETVSLEKQIDIDTKLAKLVPIDAAYFYEKYGVPPPAQTEPTTAQPNNLPTKPAKNKSETENKMFSADKSLFLKSEKNLFKKVLNYVTKSFDLLKKSEGADVANWLDTIAQTKPTTFAPLFEFYNDFFQKGFTTDYKPENIDFNTAQGANFLALQYDIARFAAAKHFRVLTEIIKAPEAERIFIWNKHMAWLKTEKDHFTAVGQMTAKWYDIQNSPIPYLRYVTAGDEHVRKSHQALNGTVLPKDHEFWRTHFPPLGWNCRCTVRQVKQADYDKVPADKRTPPDVQPDSQEFNNNPAITGVAMPETHSYYKKLTEKQKQSLAELVGNSQVPTPSTPLQVNIANRKAEYKALSEEWSKHYFDESTGGYVAIHKQADKKDLKDNKEVGLILAKNGYSVLINKHILINNTPNPELTLNGVITDLKTPDPKKYTSIVGGIRNSFHKSADQQKLEAVVIRIIADETLVDIAEGLRKGFEKNKSIHTAWVILKNNAVKEITRGLYESKVILKELEK